MAHEAGLERHICKPRNACSYQNLEEAGSRFSSVTGRESEACQHFGFLKIFIDLFLAVLGLCCCLGFSLVAASGGGYSLVAVRGFLIAMLLLLWSTGSRMCRLQELPLLGSRLSSYGTRA